MHIIRSHLLIIAIPISLVLIVVGGLLAVLTYHGSISNATWHQLMQSDQTLSSILHKSPIQISAHLTDTNQPLPTNKWFSDLAFDQKEPVFAYPLSYALTPQGFTVSYARPVINTDTVSTPHTSDIAVSFNRTTTAEVNGYDDLSVTMAHKTGSTTVATSHITEGSPFIFISLTKGHTATVTSNGTLEAGQSNTIYVHLANKIYGVTAARRPTVNGQSIQLASDFAVYILPEGATEADYAAAAHSPLTNASVGYKQNGNQYVTTYTLTTANGKPTIWGTIPPQVITVDRTNGTLPSLAGIETFVKGTSFTGSQLFKAPASALTVSKLSSTERANVTRQLALDIATTTFSSTDSYGAGKELYRAANLLQLAQQLGQNDQAARIKAKLTDQLNMWLDPTGYRSRTNKYFYYDTAFRGLVGVDASYGSDQFNDHHFHYGYILYAAAILSEYDHSFMQAHQSMINLIVRDIANPIRDNNFPRLRVFDSYFGHSWASGTSPFGDGNNQESSSEAVLAWAATYKWALVSKDTVLQQLAGWLYTRESSAARNQWLDPNATFSGYTHPFVSLVWGGKLDYATWFSANPAALLAIQLIPLSPAHIYALDNANSVRANEATVGGQPTLFKDYIAMYTAGTDTRAAARTIEALQPFDFDSANSKAYALTWVYTQTP